jgi:hypothetical protein
MRTRLLVPWSAAILALLALLWTPALVAGQTQTREQVQEAARKASPRSGDEAMKYFESEVEKQIAEATKRVYDPAKPLMANPPRTAWGEPDLQGYYLTVTYTPLQRPTEVTKPLYTVQEAIIAFKTATDVDAGVDPATVHYDWKEFGMDAWQSPVRPNMRTGLIIDPADGRMPPLTAEAQQRRADAAARAKIQDPQTSVSTFPSFYTRCAMGNGAIPLVDGPGRSTEMQIHQSPGFVTIIHQSNNDVRIIPTSGGSKLPETNRHWDGVSRGRWEGNTLVVETTNFLDRKPSNNIQNATDAMQIVERFSVLDENTLRYEYTVTDPKTWTRPWSVEAPLPKIAPPLYEFACHEQNYGVINVVMGAQIRATLGEKQAGLGE